MSESRVTARPYAKAAFDYAVSQNAEARWSECLSLMAEAVQDAEASAFLKNPRVTQAMGEALLVAALGDTVFPELQNFLSVLGRNKRFLVLPEISALFEELWANARCVRTVRMTTAHPLSDALRERFANALKKRWASEIELHCVVDESLIAGCVIQDASQVIDASLRYRLTQLFTAMTQ